MTITQDSRGGFQRRLSLVAGGMIALSLAALGPTAGDAHAATIGRGYYIAGPGETNSLDVSYDPATGNHTFTDTGVGPGAITDADGMGDCTVVGNTATCPPGSMTDIRIELRDGDDTARISTTAPLTSILAVGGSGADTVSVSSTAVPSVAVLGDGFGVEGPGDGGDTLSTAGVSGPAVLVKLEGGGGNDTITDGPAPSQVYGGLGSDVIDGGGGNDQLFGRQQGGPRQGEDPAIASADGADVVRGGEGADYITGGAGADDLQAEGGDDTVYDGDGPGESFAANNLRSEGDDRIDGGDGGDIIYAFEGADLVQGGPGDDNITLRQFEGGELVAAADTVVCGSGDDRVGLGEGDIADMDCELIIMPISCPPEAPRICEVDLAVVASTESATAGASAQKKRPRQILLGHRTRKVKIGMTYSVPVRLRQERVKLALRGRKKVPASAVEKVRSGKKKLRGSRIRFTLRK